MEDKLKEFERLQRHVRENPTDWATFFEAAELWQEIMEKLYEPYDYEKERLATERWLAEHEDQGFWTRLRTRITKRGQRT